MIAQRPPGKRYEGLWEFPGGKVEEGENFFMACKREMQEEMGIEITSCLFHSAISDTGSWFRINFCWCEYTGDPIAKEHTGLKWVTIEELKTGGYAFAPAMISFVKAMKTRDELQSSKV